MVGGFPSQSHCEAEPEKQDKLSQGALWCLLWPPVICRGCSLTAAPQRLYSQVRLQRSRAVRSEPQKGAQPLLPKFAFRHAVYHND